MVRLFGLLVAVGTAASSATAAQTYPLKCRPGSATALVLSVSGDFRFSFVRASQGAGVNGQHLAPGQCAWVDRSVGPNEPAVVAMKTSNNFQVGAVVPHASNTSFRGYAYAASQAWVYNFMTKDTILTVHAFNDGQVMRVPNP